MTSDDVGKTLSHLIGELQELEALAYVKELIDDGVSPMTIFDLSHAGMVKVGHYYEKERYAISGLIMAGEIMRQIGEMVFPLIDKKSSHTDAGKIVLGTVEGDIHFLGKDIFKTLVRGHGFTVHDLGVDVSPSTFLSAIYDIKPDIVGLSCLISGAYGALGECIDFLKANIPEHLQPRSYIVGGRINRLLAKDVGADEWTSDAMQGVHLCEKIMKTV
jgi:methanogenic corrinoid protein MtbC1